MAESDNWQSRTDEADDEEEEVDETVGSYMDGIL